MLNSLGWVVGPKKSAKFLAKSLHSASEIKKSENHRKSKKELQKWFQWAQGEPRYKSQKWGSERLFPWLGQVVIWHSRDASTSGRNHRNVPSPRNFRFSEIFRDRFIPEGPQTSEDQFPTHSLVWEGSSGSLEGPNLDWKFQSRISRIPHKNRGLLGGSIENFNLDWKFQSRRAILIIFSIFGSLGVLVGQR